MDNYREPIITVEEAIELILGSIKPLEPEEIPFLNATGRVLFEDIVSDINVPPLDNSAMDGYEINAIPRMLFYRGKQVINGHFDNSTVSLNRLNPSLVNRHGPYWQ